MNSRLWPIALTISVLAVSTIFIFDRIIGRGERVIEKVLDWPEKVAKGAGLLFQAKTSITNNSVSLPAEGIWELNLIQRQILCFTKQENTYMGSTATRIVKGVYKVKVGYDLREGMKMTFDEKTKTIFIELPKPKINSMEGVPETFYLSGGVVKWEPTTSENDEGNRQNRDQAWREAAGGLTTEAEDRMKQRIRDIFSPFAANVVFISPTSESPQSLLEPSKL